MARHPLGPQARRRARNRTFTVLALLVVILAIAFMYGPFGADAGDDKVVGDSSLAAGSTSNVNAPEVPDANVVTTFGQGEPNESRITTPQPEVVAEPDTAVVRPEPNVPEVAVEPGLTDRVEPNRQADLLIAKAATLIGRGTSGIVEARDSLNQAMRMPLSPRQYDYVKSQLSELSNAWLFSRAALPGDPLCESYRVMPGDILETIGRQHKVPYEILMQINKISSARSLQAGQTIKVVNGPFHAKVHRSTFTMDIYLQNTYVRSFTVGLGKPGYETPTGLWRLRPGGKAYATQWRDPDTGKLYQPEDPDYPLGSRWMALDGLSGEAKDRQGFGIHGTKEPEQIGTAGSRGCIRMYNGEAIQVYNMLVEGLSQVEVID